MNRATQLGNSQRMGFWGIVIVVILLIPLIFGAPWTGGDYIFSGVVLYALAAVYDLSTRNTNNTWHKVAVGVAILFTIFLIMGWAATGP